MKKQEFLDKLKSRLSILNDEEVDDILYEYEAHINEKISAGKTEEQATADFGDFNELIKEILSAYKIKDKEPYESRSRGEFETWIHKAIDEITEFMKPLINKISTLQGEQVGYFIAYLILTLIMVSLIGIPFWIVDRLGVALLSVIPLGVGQVFGTIFSALLNIAQLVVSILIIIYGIQRAIEAATLKKPVKFGFTINDEVKTEPSVKVEPKEKAEPKVDVKANPNPDPSPRVTVIDRSEKQKERVILPFIGTLFVLLFKGFVVICMIPGFMVAFGLIIALGVMIALFFKGVYFIGLFLILIGLLTATTTVLDMIYRTVFKGGVQHA
jgi:uncharacterized membrane protein